MYPVGNFDVKQAHKEKLRLWISGAVAQERVANKVKFVAPIFTTKCAKSQISSWILVPQSWILSKFTTSRESSREYLRFPFRATIKIYINLT